MIAQSLTGWQMKYDERNRTGLFRNEQSQMKLKREGLAKHDMSNNKEIKMTNLFT